MKKLIVLSAALAIAASASATSAEQSAKVEKDACASLIRISGVQALDSRTAVIFSSTGKPAYLATLAMPLPDLKFAMSYAYIDRDGDGRLCGRSSDAIGVPDDRVSMSSRIMAMESLDAEKIQALEEKYNVRLTRKKDRKATEAEPAESAD
jgi:hypothetical protein